MGQNLSLFCSVSEPAQFSWRFEDGPLPGNAMADQDQSSLSSTLLISDVVLENAGAYTCRVSNTVRGVVNEDTAYVTVVGE